MSHTPTDSLRHLIAQQGGVIRETRDGYEVDFPDQAPTPTCDHTAPERQRVDAAAIEAAIERAREYSTTIVRLWRERGEGWYAASSHAEHPGFSYVCQIDERTGEPLGCECIATAICHHLGAAILSHRERIGYEENGAAVLADWEATLEIIREYRQAPVEEEW